MASTVCTPTLLFGASQMKIILKYHKGLTSLTHAFHPRVIITTPQQKYLRTKSHFWIQLCTKGNGLSVRQFPKKERILSQLKHIFQYTHFTSCPPLGIKIEGFYKRRSPSVTQNKFLNRKLSKRTRRIPKAP